jgi:hypothetical protein
VERKKRGEGIKGRGEREIRKGLRQNIPFKGIPPMIYFLQLGHTF